MNKKMEERTLLKPKTVRAMLTDGFKSPCAKTLNNLRKSLKLEELGLCVKDGNSYKYSYGALVRINQRGGYIFKVEGVK